MLFKKLPLPLIFAILLVAGLAFFTTLATANVTPILTVTDMDDAVTDIQVYGIKAESVTFELTVTFQNAEGVNTEVTGFDVSDIELIAADSSGKVVQRGAIATSVQPNDNRSVYTTTITVEGNVDKVIIRVPKGAANTLGRLVDVEIVDDDPTQRSEPKVIHVIRSATPPLTLSDDMPISGNSPFTVTLTSTQAITLRRTDIDVTGGFIPSDGLSADATRKVWTVTIVPGVSVKEITVKPVPTGSYIFPKGTFTVGVPITRQGSVRTLTGMVTISEIMFATNRSTNEIQWIELFNSSNTEAVALDADSGWSLIIENYDDPNRTEPARFGRINFKNDGDVKTIPPNQTVLIVSSRGRNSDSAHFVPTRVFKVYSELAAEFGMRSPRDPFLHPTRGFHIKLVDGRNELADEVGNLDGKIRTFDQPTWQLPDGRTEAGDRTSIIRRYRNYNQRTRVYTKKGIAHDGTQREGWIPAAETGFSYVSRKNVETWYGSSFDYGTPGLRAGHALPVQLSHFRPERTETGIIVIKWTTESEVDNAGFNILRSQTKVGEFKTINTSLIQGAGTTSERNTYTWTDTTAKPNVVYYYRIEDISFAGERQTLATSHLRGLISAKGRLTTQWGELKHLRD